MFASRKIFSGRATSPLAEEVCRLLGQPLGKADIMKFKNDNKFVQIKESVRACDVFVFQTSCPPVDENLMELLLMIDALKRASAERITAVLPYYPYARSDKKDQARIPITGRLVADLLTVAGCNRVVALDLHSAQIGGFFSIPLDHLAATKLFCDYILKKQLKSPVAVACDAGGAKNAIRFARGIGAPLAIMEKHRLGNSDQVEVAAFIGDVRGRQAIIYEDEISSGGTIAGAVDVLKENGAAEIYVCATHGVLCDNAVSKLAKKDITEIIITDSVPHAQKELAPNYTVLPIAPLFAEAIMRIHQGDSTSDLFHY